METVGLIYLNLSQTKNKMNIILIAIIALNILISYKGFEDVYFFRKYEFHIGSIQRGEKIRMFSSAFLHGDWMHLAFNMYTLYMFAPIVIGYSNNFTFLLIYVASLIFGNLLTLVLHKDDYNYR